MKRSREAISGRPVPQTQVGGFTIILIMVFLTGCSWFSPRPQVFALTFRNVTLSPLQPSDAEFQVKLVKIAPDGTTDLEALATGERASAQPGATFEFLYFQICGIQLVSASA